MLTHDYDISTPQDTYMYGGLILTFISHNILLFQFLRSWVDRRIQQNLPVIWYLHECIYLTFNIHSSVWKRITNVKVTFLRKYDLMLASHRNGFFSAYYFMHKRNIVIDYYIVCYLNILCIMFTIIAFFMKNKTVHPGICEGVTF